MDSATFKVWRGDQEGGDFESYDVDLEPGYVVLDSVGGGQNQNFNQQIGQ